MRAKRFGIALAFAVAAVLVFVIAASWPLGSSLSCNGSPSLCDRAYNKVSYLTSHNAMSSSERRFLEAEQEPDIVGQLDEGVRGLMLDLHTWTTPAQAAPVLAGLIAQPARRARSVDSVVRSASGHLAVPCDLSDRRRSGGGPARPRPWLARAAPR